jgi:hypothetical protein
VGGAYHLTVLFVTIWVALALFAIAEAGKGPLLIDGRPPRWARPASILGALLAIAHALIAFHARYHWDHEAAVVATATQAAALYGAAWSGSLYVNYVFLALWLLPAWQWRHWLWRAFVLTMIVNGAILFARPAARPFGVVLVGVLLWAWSPSRRPKSLRIARHDVPLGG